MKFIQVSILSLVSLLVISSAKAAIQDRSLFSPMMGDPTTQTSPSDRPMQLAATIKSGTLFIVAAQN